MSSQASPVTVEAKIATAKESKDKADQAFKAGDLKAALANYHGSLFYLLGIDKNAMQGMGITPKTSVGETPTKEKTEVDDLIEKIYANMSACHMKSSNWKRCIETADKALAKNADNFKAKFRKAKSLGELGYYERAVKLLDEVKQNNPSDTAIVDAELARLKAIDNEREKAVNKKLKGFLSRDKGEKKVPSEKPIESITSGFIEEVTD